MQFCKKYDTLSSYTSRRFCICRRPNAQNKTAYSPDAQRIAMSQRTKFIPRTAYFIMLTGEHQTEYGELAERSKAAVLKTVVVKATWGSNP